MTPYQQQTSNKYIPAVGMGVLIGNIGGARGLEWTLKTGFPTKNEG